MRAVIPRLSGRNGLSESSRRPRERDLESLERLEYLEGDLECNGDGDREAAPSSISGSFSMADNCRWILRWFSCRWSFDDHSERVRVDKSVLASSFAAAISNCLLQSGSGV